MSDKQYREVRLPNGEKIKGVTAKIEVDPNTYEIKHQYFRDGKECQKVILLSEQAKNFAAYALIKKDLKYVLKAFKYAMSIAQDEVETEEDGDSFYYRTEIDADADILKAFYISGIVTYGKCFAKADGRRVKLEYKEIFREDEKELRKLHLELMDQRHQYVAHGGKTRYEKVNTILVLHLDKERNLTPTLMTESFHVDGFGKKDFGEFLDLVTTVDERLNELLNKKSNSLYKKEIQPKDNMSWYIDE
ncbi:hypothetical protein QWY82_18415 [Simiduia curdlanivorans]|uniref:Apea-like HEPN domain-containing protein n=1 Tax=Simiduia curdlanivorans TaxID=1492769 RepID=A0ABV8V517_9GAMM|nr:hypothetical protein [Simiduia curdlanivorans]MDN3640779.1 hypothetical protein [Simiduia curdlanivorans]